MASYRSPEIIASQILQTKPPLLGDRSHFLVAPMSGGVLTTVKRLNNSSSVTKKTLSLQPLVKQRFYTPSALPPLHTRSRNSAERTKSPDVVV